MTQKTGVELIDEAKTRIREVSSADVLAMMAGVTNVVYLDVRESNEFNVGHLPGALHIPRGSLELRVEGIVPRDASVVIYCTVGNRSALAAETLQRMGYTNAVSLAGGFRDWMMSGSPVEG